MGESRAASDHAEVTDIVEAEVVSEHEAAPEKPKKEPDPDTIYQGSEPGGSDSGESGSSGPTPDTIYQGEKTNKRQGGKPGTGKPGPTPDTIYQG
jgi:hypothetical protein